MFALNFKYHQYDFYNHIAVFKFSEVSCGSTRQNEIILR